MLNSSSLNLKITFSSRIVADIPGVMQINIRLSLKGFPYSLIVAPFTGIHVWVKPFVQVNPRSRRRIRLNDHAAEVEITCPAVKHLPCDFCFDTLPYEEAPPQELLICTVQIGRASVS